MAKNQNISALVVSLLVTLGLIGAGLWFLSRQFLPNLGAGDTPPSAIDPASPSPAAVEPSQPTSSPAPVGSEATANLDTSLPNPSLLEIDGSVTMVAMIKRLQVAYSQVNPRIPTSYGVPDGKPNGSNTGIQNLLDGTVQLAASSRPLRAEELQEGLQPVPIARDAIAVVIGVNNPFQGELTLDQLKQIFQGRITNWSQVGGPNAPIKVYNRAPASGTSSLFRDIVLLGEEFAPDGENFVTFEQDVTTPILQALGSDGISYSTVQQVENQQTVRIVSIEGVSPIDREAIRAGSYPISRVVYLVTTQSTSPAVKQFIDTALSEQGQQIVERTGFIRL
jgi:phosphate transport system substrate-binding protein